MWLFHVHIDGLVQERRVSIATALELCLSCTNPSIFSNCSIWDHTTWCFHMISDMLSREIHCYMYLQYPEDLRNKMRDSITKYYGQRLHDPYHQHVTDTWDEIQTEVWRADSRFVPSQWETALLCNDVSHWLGASLESALGMYVLDTCTL